MTPRHPPPTTNDIVAWIPERGVLFSGDLICKDGTPFLLQGSVAGWIETLGLMKALGAETIVLGHGEICGPEAISERLVGNLHRTYSELRGEPPGVAPALPPIIGDMQSLIGGPIVSHA